MKSPYIYATGLYRFTDECPTCKGNGRVRLMEPLEGWYIDYHYQDGHEQSGPMSKEEAIRLIQDHIDKSINPTLVGPDGQIYTLTKPKTRFKCRACEGKGCTLCDNGWSLT